MKPRRLLSATTFSINCSRGTVKLAPYSPPGAASARPGPTSPHGGEAKCNLDTTHPAIPLRGLDDLPTRWGGEMQDRYSPTGTADARPGHLPTPVMRRHNLSGCTCL